MKAKARLITNSQQLQHAEKMGTPCDPEYGLFDFYFDCRIITISFINAEGEINVCLAGQMWALQYDEKLWKQIKQLLEPR